MADSIGTAFVDVAFDPKQIQGQLGGLGGKVEGGFGKLGGKWGAAAATGFGAAVVAGVAAGKYLYDVGEQFDAMADSIRVSTGKTGKELDALVKTAKGVGTDVPASFEDAGKAVASVSTRLGLTGKPLREVSDQMLELSRLGGKDLAQTLNTVTRMLGDAGVKGEDTAAAIDKLWRAAQASGVPFDRLSDLLTKFGGPMRQLGFSFDEQAAFLAKFEKEGVNTELVMGSMRIALGKMAKAGKDPQKELRRVMAAIKDTGDAGEANAKAIELFGARAGPDMAAAIREGRFEVDDLVKTIAKGKDTVRTAGKDTADFSEQWLLFKNNVAAKLEPVATKLFSAIGEGMAFVNEELPPLVRGLRRDLGPTLDEVGDAFVDVRKIIVDLMPVWKLLAEVVELTARRIIDTVKGLVEIIGGMVKLVRALLEGDWAGAWDAAKQIVDGVAKVIKAQLDYIVRLVELVTRPLRDAAAAVGEAIKDGIVGGVKGVGDAVGNLLGQLDDRVRAVLGAVSGAARSVGTAIKDGVVSGITGIGDAVANYVGQLDDRVRNVVSQVANAGRSVGSAIKDGVVAGVTGVGDSVAGFVGQIDDRVRAVLGAVTSAGRAIGVAIKDGVVAGVTGIGDAVAGLVAGLDDRVRAVAGTAAAAARAVGVAIKNGVISGLSGLGSAIYNAVRGAISSAIDRVKGLGGIAGKALGAIGLGAVVPGPAPTPTAAAAATGPAATAAAPAGGTLYGRSSPLGALTRQLASAARASAAAVAEPVTLVRVYIGDEELRGIVRTEVGVVDDATARVLLAGAR